MAAPGVGVRQHGKEAGGQDLLQGGRPQVVEDFGPASPAAVVVDEQLEGPVVVKLAGADACRGPPGCSKPQNREKEGPLGSPDPRLETRVA